MFELIFKRYAPFDAFGGGFHGDGRKTPNITASARTWGHVTFSMEKGIIQYSAKSSPTFHSIAPDFKKTQTPTIAISNYSISHERLSFTAHTAGSNPLIAGSPDIDTFLDIEITGSEPSTSISTKMRGDDFPSGEVFLRVSGRPQLLIDFRTTHGALAGPSTRLFGVHSKQILGTFEGQINLVG